MRKDSGVDAYKIIPCAGTDGGATQTDQTLNIGEADEA